MGRSGMLAIVLGLAACSPPPAAAPTASTAPLAPNASTGALTPDLVRSRQREISRADRDATQDTLALLRNAREALAGGGGGDRATEMLERAESRLLTRDTDVGAERVAMNEGPQSRIISARRAINAGDRAGAIQSIDQAIAQLQRGA